MGSVGRTKLGVGSARHTPENNGENVENPTNNQIDKKKNERSN